MGPKRGVDPAKKMDAEMNCLCVCVRADDPSIEWPPEGPQPLPLEALLPPVPAVEDEEEEGTAGNKVEVEASAVEGGLGAVPTGEEENGSVLANEGSRQEEGGEEEGDGYVSVGEDNDGDEGVGEEEGEAAENESRGGQQELQSLGVAAS